MLDDDSDDDGSDSGFACTRAFLFCFGESVFCVDDSVGCGGGMGYGIFVPIGIESIGDIVPLVVFVPI